MKITMFLNIYMVVCEADKYSVYKYVNRAFLVSKHLNLENSYFIDEYLVSTLYCTILTSNLSGALSICVVMKSR